MKVRMIFAGNRETLRFLITGQINDKFLYAYLKLIFEAIR